MSKKMKTYLSFNQLCYLNNQTPELYDGKKEALKWFRERERQPRRNPIRKYFDRLFGNGKIINKTICEK